jgi:hypothetical protein
VAEERLTANPNAIEQERSSRPYIARIQWRQFQGSRRTPQSRRHPSTALQRFSMMPVTSALRNSPFFNPATWGTEVFINELQLSFQHPFGVR